MNLKPFVFLVMSLIAVLALARGWKSEGGALRTNLIESDGIGYYMYLPAIFISQNLSHQEVDNRYIFNQDGRAVNKYFAGTAYLMAPFFGVAALIDYPNEGPINPYSRTFQLAIAIAALFYFFIGLFTLFRLMREMRFTDVSICISMVALVFGTNLLVYTVYHPSLSHVYSFACNTLFLWCAHRLFRSPSNRMLMCASALLGLAVAIRPINLLIVLTIPLLGVKREELHHAMKFGLQYRRLLLACATIGLILLPQFVLWRIQSGSWFLQSYKNEGFYFNDPEITNFLFSFRKGLFIYSPILLISVCGALFFAPLRMQRVFFALFFVVFVYISASWWNWYYGPSFGQRVVVDFASVMVVGLAFLVQHFYKLKYRAILIGFLGILVILNLIQSYQYAQNILCSWNMNFEKYKYVFLSIDKSKQGVFGGQDDIAPFGQAIQAIATRTEDFNNDEMPAGVDGRMDRSKNMEGLEFSPAWELPAPSKWVDFKTHYAEIELSVWEECTNACKEALLVFEIKSTGSDRYFYRAIRLMDVPDGEPHQWIQRKYSIETDVIKREGDTIRAYLWNKDKANFLLDNVRITLFDIQ
jgi:hypothetical protein